MVASGTLAKTADKDLAISRYLKETLNLGAITKEDSANGARTTQLGRCLIHQLIERCDRHHGMLGSITGFNDGDPYSATLVS